MLNKLLTIFLLTGIQMSESTLDYDRIREDCRVWLNCDVTVNSITQEQYFNDTWFDAGIKIYDTPIFEGRTNPVHSYCQVSVNMKEPVETNDTFPISSMNLTQFNMFFDNIGETNCYDENGLTVIPELIVFNNHTAIDIYFYPLIAIPRAKTILTNTIIDFVVVFAIFYCVFLCFVLVWKILVQPLLTILCFFAGYFLYRRRRFVTTSHTRKY